MTDNTHAQIQGPQPEATDELQQLAALLQRLEQSDHLSLDELDAVIMQADTAYRSRLARLDRTRALIAQLGRSVAGA